MNLQEIKTILEEQVRLGKKDIFNEHVETPMIDLPFDPTIERHLKGKLIGIFPQFRRPIHDDDFAYAKSYGCLLKYSDKNSLAQLQFYIESVKENKDKEILSRIQVIGTDLNLISGWNFCDCEKSSTYSFGLKQSETDLFPPSIAIPEYKLNCEGNSESTRGKNVVFVILEIGKPFYILKNTEQAYQHVLLNNELFGPKDFKIHIQNRKDNGGVETVDTETVDTETVITETVEVHKFILQEPSETKVEETKPGTVKEFIKYLYNGKCDLKTFAPDIFRFADQYNVVELKDLSEKYLSENIENIPWKEVFSLLETYGNRIKVLRNTAKKYYQKNKEALDNIEEFRDLCDNYANLSSELGLQ